MTAQRDANGRFIKGNNIAKGNKGNTRGKWGNQNALKHGNYSYYRGLFYNKGFLYVIINGYSVGVLSDKDYFIRKEYGTINVTYVKSKVAEHLVNVYHIRKRSLVAIDDSGYLRYISAGNGANAWIVMLPSARKNVIRA